MKILLVEDEKGLIVTLTDRLLSEGFEVRVGGGREEGIRSGDDGAFDLIILDVMLPKKNGYDVCRDLGKRA